MKIVWDEPEGTGWQPIESGPPPDDRVVDVWMQIAPSARSMGLSDEFGVPDAWRSNGRWQHVYRGKPEELDGSYVSHWRERQPGALAFGPGWGPAPQLENAESPRA